MEAVRDVAGRMHWARPSHGVDELPGFLYCCLPRLATTSLLGTITCGRNANTLCHFLYSVNRVSHDTECRGKIK
jgi:hypothetical protein